MSQVAISGNASGTGTLTIAAPNTNSNYTLTLPQATTTLVGTDATQTLTNKTIQGGAITSGTAVASTSGTSVNFTGIPSWVKRITVMFQGVSTSGTSFWQIQLGSSGGVEATGYVVVMMNSGGGSTLDTSISTGFGIRANSAGYIVDGLINISKISGNAYVASGTFSATGAGTGSFITSGSKTLSNTLDRVRITTVNGTDTFDAGSINIMYEG